MEMEVERLPKHHDGSQIFVVTFTHDEIEKLEQIGYGEDSIKTLEKILKDGIGI